MGDALEACGTAYILDVHDDDADDFAETQGRDGEIVAAQPERRQPNQKAKGSGPRCACKQCDNQRQVEIRGEHDAHIGAHCHEARVAKGELPRIAVDEIQADGHDDIDADQEQVQLPEGADRACGNQSLQQGEQRDAEDEHDQIISA